MKIEIGMQGEAEASVRQEDTATHVGSGSLAVYATPCMAALMEAAACRALEAGLEAQETSVGTALELQHVSATPVGMKVWAQAQVTAVEGRTVCFAIRAFDEAGPIGTAVHKRVVVNAQRFTDKAYAKL